MKTVTLALSFIALTSASANPVTPLPEQSFSITAATSLFRTPVQFETFRIHRRGKDVVLRWSVDVPANASAYTVQRSYDGEFFDDIAVVPASAETAYSYEDLAPFPGIIYYRIVAANTDLSTTESAAETIRIVSR